jgi:hypothetical protein
VLHSERLEQSVTTVPADIIKEEEVALAQGEGEAGME